MYLDGPDYEKYVNTRCTKKETVLIDTPEAASELMAKAEA